jgi:hypothetical protein
MIEFSKAPLKSTSGGVDTKFGKYLGVHEAMRDKVAALLQSYPDATRSSGTAKQESILVQHYL